RERAAAVPDLYGGVVTPWKPPTADEGQFEVVTTAKSLDILVPPGQPVTQWMEMWAAGGCARRCDGVTEVLTIQPCLCPDDVDKRNELAKKGQACKITTRLSVMLPALPDLG